MTVPLSKPPAVQRWLSLHNSLVLMFVAAALYAGALPVYLFVRIGSAASTLARHTEAVVAVLEDFERRSTALDRARYLARVAAEGNQVPAPTSLDQIAALLHEAAAPDAAPVAAAPPALREEIALADTQIARIETVLQQAVGSLRQGRRAVAARELSVATSLDATLGEALQRVSRAGRQSLAGAQAAVQATGSEVRLDTALWLVVGLLLTWLGLLVIRRRILRPLSELEAGLGRVSEGDLNTQVRVHRPDEVGRLADHFNEMTRVLRNRAEEQGRFAAAGELLAGVAHEVNNPLMAIAAHAENRLADPGLPPDLREETLQVLRQAQRATKLLRGLLRFVRVADRQVASVNLNDVIRGALDLVSYRFGVDEITVTGQLDPKLPAVSGDPIRLEQVFVNLLSNAVDALRGIRPPRTLKVDSWVTDGGVSVSVADNGSGVAPEVAARLFRPFATTKGRRGTGLGLYISRQIVRESGGELNLAPGAAGGARFVLTLPVAPRPEPAAGSLEPVLAETAPAAVPAAPGAQGRLAGVRVLIVDDEAAIRRPMAKFLTRRGAQVLEAGDGGEALALLEHESVDVILADLRMPRMSGTELFSTLEVQRPELAGRVVFLSGDVSQLAEPGNTPVPRERVLVKPVELSELERRVAEFVSRR